MTRSKLNRWDHLTTNHIHSLSSRSTRHAVFALLTLVALVLFIFHPLPSYYSSELVSPSSSSKAFSLIVDVKFQDKATKAEFVELIQPLATYVKYHEPTTIGYEVLFSDKDDLQALLVERYKDKEEAYLKIHKSSKEFLDFRPKLQAMQEAGRVTLSGNSYWDGAVGFVGRI